MTGDLLLQTFEEELRRSVKASQGLLLSLDESASKAADVHEVYRLAHSLKGASRVVGLSQIEAIAHLVEDQLQGLVRKGMTPDRDLVDLLVKSLDGLVSAYEAFVSGEAFDEEPLLEKLTASIRNLTENETPEPKSPEPESGQRGEGERSQVAKASAKARDSASAPDPEKDEQSPGQEPRRPERRKAQPAAPPKELSQGTRRDESVRVPTTIVDELFRKIEEAFLLESRLTNELAHWDEEREKPPDIKGLLRASSRLHQVLLQAHGFVRAFRMEAFDTLRVPVQKAVRELSASLGKPTALTFSGRAQLVDAALLDGLHEPLLHVVRNAMDHGIEDAHHRARSGKKAEATLEVSGEITGGSFLLSVQDDGRGFSIETIKTTALARGLVTESDLEEWTRAQWLDLPFRSGFSTAPKISAISGRGLGLDIVRDRIRRLGGDVTLTTTEGQGSTVTMRVPVGVLTMRLLLVRCGERQVAIPIENIERVASIRNVPLEVEDERTFVRWDGAPVPVRRLDRILGWEGGSEAAVLILLRFGDIRRGLVVDEALSQVEQPVFPTPRSLRRLGHVGALMLSADGQVIPVLEPAEAMKKDDGSREVLRASPAPSSAKRVVLVVDDSSTIRVLHRSVLNGLGFDVLAAEDGVQALETLAGHQIDLILTDIEMPRMDGLSLIRKIRQSPAWRHLPVIVVSQYGRREDLEKGAEAGADRYIVKSQFEPERLSAMVSELLD